MPRFDPATWRLRDRRARRAAADAHLRRAARAAARRAGLDLPLRHRLVGRRTSTGPASACDDLLAPAGPLPGARASDVRLGGDARTSTRSRVEQAGPGRRDARLRDGREAALDARTARRPRLVIPEMYGYKNVKWVERIVARRPRPSPGTGSSAATTRTRGWRLEWRSERRLTSSASPARSAPCTGCTRPRFFVLLATGLVLYLPWLSEPIGRRPLVKEVHLLTAVAWVVALALVVVARRPARAAAARCASSTASTPTTAAGCGGRPAPQGRFNAGQKVNAVLTACVRAALRRLGHAALARRARHALPARRHRSSSTTR